MIITIDGPAGAGKSTVARRLAARLGIEFLDTGAGYRAVALFLLQRQHDAALPDEALAALLPHIRFEFRDPAYFLNGEEVTLALRQPEVSEMASRLAERGLVREFCSNWQRTHARGRHLVTEGRDQGTVVFPQADCKFFLTASAETRLERRHKELAQRGHHQSKEDLARVQRERDHRDSHRALAPLQPAPDAIHVDSTGLDIEQVVDLMEAHVRAGQSSFSPPSHPRS